jgi:predicted transcriptional regulator
MTDFQLLTADAVLTAVYTDPTWIVPGLIPAGLTLLAGRAKTGKSWLALQIAQAVGLGGMVLGQRVQQGRVLYIALEDSQRRVCERMKRQHWPLGASVEFMYAAEFRQKVGSLALRGKQACRGAEDLKKHIEAGKYRLVIVDTLARAGLGDQMDQEAMTDALAPIQELAQARDLGFLFNDHHAKVGGADPDVILNILGATSKGGVADTLLGLYRKRGESEAKLYAEGRDLEHTVLALRFDGLAGCWQSLGKAAAIELTERRQEILDALGVLGAATLSDIAKSVGQDKGNTKRRVDDLLDAGLIVLDRSLGILRYRVGTAFDAAMASA